MFARKLTAAFDWKSTCARQKGEILSLDWKDESRAPTIGACKDNVTDALRAESIQMVYTEYCPCRIG